MSFSGGSVAEQWIALALGCHMRQKCFSTLYLWTSILSHQSFEACDVFIVDILSRCPFVYVRTHEGSSRVQDAKNNSGLLWIRCAPGHYKIQHVSITIDVDRIGLRLPDFSLETPIGTWHVGRSVKGITNHGCHCWAIAFRLFLQHFIKCCSSGRSLDT